MRFSALDGWRGICALAVATAHIGGVIAWTGRELAPTFDSNIFVDYFFVLSGFVIAYTYDDRIADTRSVAVFMLRRFGRLWPLHAAVLALYVLLEAVALIVERHFGGITSHAAFTYDKSLEAIVTNLLLIQALGVHGMFTWNSPSWSISVEFWTYLVFACMVLVARNHRMPAAAALMLTGLLVLVVSGRYMWASTDYGIFRCLYGFFMGYLVFRFGTAQHKRPAMAPIAGTIVEICVLILVLLFLVYLDHEPWSLLAVPVFALSVYVFSREQGLVSRLLSGPPFRQLGAWSYSIYMIHMLMLTLFAVAMRLLEQALHISLRSSLLNLSGDRLFGFGSWLADDLVVIAFLLAVILASSLTFRFIEDPCRRYANMLANRLDLPVRAAARSLGK